MQGSQPLIAAADGIRTVAVELALILAYASVVETFNLVGVNGTLSAQMEIAGINGAVIALVLGLLVLAGGLLLGTPSPMWWGRWPLIWSATPTMEAMSCP